MVHGSPEMLRSKAKLGGLVSRRVSMYESPNKTSPVSHSSRSNYGYNGRSYSKSPPNNPVRESRDVENSSDSNYVGCHLIEAGVQHYTLGEYNDAIKAFNTALKSQRASVGDNHICIALTLGNLGAAYLQVGEINLAERVLVESLKIKSKLAPKISIADTLNNLGNCANLRGDFKKSLTYYDEALNDLHKKECTPQAVANTLFNIGRLEIQMKNWTEAKRILTDAIRMTKEIYGPAHEFVAQNLDLIGFAQLSTEELDSAMVSFTEALGVFRQLHGPLHISVANSLFNVGMVREAKGQLMDAWEAYTTTKDLYVRLGTEETHSGFLTVLESIAKVEAAIALEKKFCTAANQRQQHRGTKEIRTDRRSNRPSQ